MRDVLSKIVHGLSWLITLLVLAATCLWVGILITRDGWAGYAFALFLTPVLAGSSLLLGVIPSFILHHQRRQRRDYWSLCLAGGSFLAILGETLVIVLARLSAC